MKTETATVLTTAEHECNDDGGETYTLAHPAGLITLRIMPDPECTNPLSPDAGDGLPALAMLRRYGRPHYIGTAEDIDEDASEYDTDDLAQYLLATRDAVAIHEITVGGRDQAPAVLYFTSGEADDIGDTAAALQAYADEYRRWEDGDCWGYVVNGPCGEDSCWGFIGDEYALEEATAALEYAVERADAELAESTYWLEREVLTV